MNPRAPLLPGRYYHIYNRGNNHENIFQEARNYPYFMNLYLRYVGPLALTYAYCLLRNHFHFLIQIREAQDPDQISQAFSNFFNAYARAFNRAYHRTGALFESPFRRLEVLSDRHFVCLVTYIHQNPQKHGFVDDFRDWPYSSYSSLNTEKPTRLERDCLLEWFGGRAGFELAHAQPADWQPISWLIQEDEGEYPPTWQV